ncbi:MAG: peptidylprolyl isomerase [Gammaproteobacteria bacterium]|nr:peptidylprolyl isomerase [Gammaproteobacteria bacterium]MDH5650789.1 peptidylprolyl isomerase [Gammaproteobacteria bacterium]
METNKGNITLELNPDKAPKTVANFLQYVDEGFYVNTIFHRVVKMNEMKVIQGGGFDTNYQYKNTRPPIINEADNGLKNERGTIAMARTLDEHSATSQFYINVMSHSFLDHSAKTPRGWGYAVFGKVVAGMDIVEAIWAIPTIPAGPFPQDVPRDPVIITRVYRAAAQPAAN